MDETGQDYRLLAERSLATRQMEGRKTNKERITIAVCTNAEGSHKLPLLVINKSLNPHCLKGVLRDQMGCMYFANEKA